MRDVIRQLCGHAVAGEHASWQLVPGGIPPMTSPNRTSDRSIVELIASLRQHTEQRLGDLTPGGPAPARLGDAMRYSLLAPAKRARAVLTQLTAMHWGAEPDRALSGAVALEMVHASSLILDDLPSMDNATLRRGRATCHRVYGEDTSILAAIALMNRAFEVVATDATLDSAVRVRIVAILARSIGPDGLSGGQEGDLHTDVRGHRCHRRVDPRPQNRRAVCRRRGHWLAGRRRY
jgi:geranylgeranyl diphosphate synthase, type II